MVLINGVVVDSWSGSGGDGAVGSPQQRNIVVDLNMFDEIEIRGTRQSGELARIDSLFISEGDTGGSPPPPPPPPPTYESDISFQIGTGRTEAEAMERRGDYVADGGAAEITREDGTGTLGARFTGSSDTYTITTRYFEEHDGISQWVLMVNGQEKAVWVAGSSSEKINGSSGSEGNRWELRSFEIDLNPGDVIEIVGRADDNEEARLDYIDIQRSNSPNPGINHSLDLEDFDMVAFAGQSNAERHFYRVGNDNSSDQYGARVFEAELQDALGGSPNAINVAIGGSGSNERVENSINFNGTQYWWDLGDNQPGPALLEAVERLQAALTNGRDLDVIIWSQGEADARDMGEGVDSDSNILNRLRQATEKVFEYFRDVFGQDILIVIQQLGDVSGLGSEINSIRSVHSSIANSMSNVVLSESTRNYDGRGDGVHFSMEGFNDIARSLAETVAEELTGQNYDAGSSTAMPQSASGLLASNFALEINALSPFLATNEAFDFAGLAASDTGISEGVGGSKFAQAPLPGETDLLVGEAGPQIVLAGTDGLEDLLLPSEDPIFSLFAPDDEFGFDLA